MAEELESNITVTRKQSIARVELFTEAALTPDDWRLVAHFEDGVYDSDGKLIGATKFGSRRIERRFGDINITVNASGNADGIADAVRAAVLDVLTDTLDRAAVTA